MDDVVDIPSNRSEAASEPSQPSARDLLVQALGEYGQACFNFDELARVKLRLEARIRELDAQVKAGVQ